MNKRSASPRTLLWASEASAERRRRRGENVALAEAPQVERREAPHPYVTGVRAPSQRRAADRVMVRRALAEAPGASRRSMSLVREGEEKWERATPGVRNAKSPGGVSVGCLTS